MPASVVTNPAHISSVATACSRTMPGVKVPWLLCAGFTSRTVASAIVVPDRLSPAFSLPSCPRQARCGNGAAARRSSRQPGDDTNGLARTDLVTRTPGHQDAKSTKPAVEGVHFVSRGQAFIGPRLNGVHAVSRRPNPGMIGRMAPLGDSHDPKTWRTDVAHLDGLNTAAVAADSAGRLVYCNAAGENLLSARREQLIGRPVIELLLPEDHRGGGREVLTHVLGGASWNGRLPFPDPASSVRTLDVSATP